MGIKQHIWNLLWDKEWNIGFIKSPWDLKTPPVIHWLNTDYKEGWFADPFILNEDEDVLEVLVEEYNYKTKLGRIDLLTIDKETYSLKNLKVILQKDTHLSFPAIIRTNSGIYVYPENSESGELTLYQFNTSTKELENPVVILNEKVVDSIIIPDHPNNRFFLYATRYGKLEDNKKLLIYESDNLQGPYQLLRTIDLNNYFARGAGDIIEIDQKVYRPAQDGSNLNEYGKGIILSQIINIQSGELKEKFKLYPTDITYPLGLHTINKHYYTYVVDGLRYKHPLIGELSWKLKNLFYQLKK